MYAQDEMENETMKGCGVTIKKKEDALFLFRTKCHQSIKDSVQVVEVVLVL